MTKMNSKPTVDGTALQGPIDAEYTDGGVAIMPTAPAGMIRTQMQYQTAVSVQVPRTLKKVEQGVMEEAALTGDAWLYSWTTKNKDGSRGVVSGEGIEAAKVLMRNWGNCACPTRVSTETPTHWIFEAVFIDLETGMSFPKLFRQRKPTAGSGRMDVGRSEDMSFGMGQSKAQRNAILAGMPSWLLDRARETAKEAAEKAIKDLPQAIERAVGFFDKVGVPLSRLENRLGKPRDRWNKRDVVTLRVIANGIKEGNSTPIDEFPLVVEGQQDNASASGESAPAPASPPGEPTSGEPGGAE